jgi:hypothetical protein
MENLTWQTRPAPPNQFEHDLADQLMIAFGAGIDDTTAIAVHFNNNGFRQGNGEPWDSVALEATLSRLSN